MTIDQQLAALEHLAGRMATDVGDPDLWADAKQEALIAAWQSIEAGKSPVLVRSNMRQAVLNVRRGRSTTGNTRKRGANGVDTHQRYAVPLVEVDSQGEEYLAVEPEEASAEDRLVEQESVDAILRAVATALTVREREAIELALLGYNNREAGELLGVSARAVSWRRADAHRKLREELAA